MSQGRDVAAKTPSQYYTSLTEAQRFGTGHSIIWKAMFSTGSYILNRIMTNRKQRGEDSKQDSNESEN